MEGLRKYVAECIGTFTLVLVGCGTAMLTGCDKWGGYLTTAFAFGLVIVGMAYCVGNISGCHINPAVSLACLISGRMSGKDFGLYFVSQTIGAILGAACLKLIFGLGGITDATGGLGSNGLGGVNGNIGAGLIAEIILTFIFILVILGVTDATISTVLSAVSLSVSRSLWFISSVSVLQVHLLTLQDPSVLLSSQAALLFQASGSSSLDLSQVQLLQLSATSSSQARSNKSRQF